jgi:hypothetical protein
MLILLSLAVLWAGWRAARGARASLRALPRSNDDLVFF